MSAIDKLKFFGTEPHGCSYLAERQASTVFVDPATEIDLPLYSQLCNLGFRRSGNFLYRPHCSGCSACIPTRVPVQTFKPNRTQTRTYRRGAELAVKRTDPVLDDEHYALYERYITARHRDGDMYPPSPEQFDDFLLSNRFDSFFLELRLADELVAVAVTDRLDNAWSAIYTYFAPELSGYSLGVLTILHQIEGARAAGLDYLYLGYWIRDCRKMNYKLQYRPTQVFVENRWTLIG